MKAEFKVLPNDPAKAAVTSRQILHISTMQKMLPELRARAFAVAYLEDLRRVERVRDAIAKVAHGSSSWQEAKREVAEEVEHVVGKEAAGTAARKIVTSETFKAVSTTRYREMTAPKEMEQFPYWQYKTVGDGRVRDAHAALNKLTLPANDPFWQDHFPPWDYGCRCRVLQISKTKANRMRADRDRHLMENEEDLKTLRAGHIKDGHGTADIRSPAQKAVTENERVKAYRHNPGDLHLSLDTIRGRYLNDPAKKDLFTTFATATQEKVLDKNTGKTVWDWLIEDDLLADAKRCLEYARETKNEMAITRRYDTGEWHATAFGTADGVDPEFPNAPHTAIHCHPSGVVHPSPADLMAFILPDTRYSSIVAECRGKVYLERWRANKSNRAQIAINDFVIKWQPIVNTDDSLKQYQLYLKELRDLQRKGFLRKEKLNVNGLRD